MQLNPLKQIEHELNARLRQQEVLAELGQRALTTTSLDDLFDETVQIVTRTLEVDYCKVLELLPDGENLLLRSGVGWKTGYIGRATVGAERHSQAGFTLLSREPVLVEDLGAETRFSGPPLLLEHNIVSGVSVVIPGRERPFGVLGAHSSQPRQFTQDDANFLKAVAHLLASSIARIAVDNTLRTSRDQLQIILQGVADGITAQDKRGRLIYANDAAAKIIGYPSAEALLNAALDEVMQKFDLLDEHGDRFPLENLPGRLVLRGQPESSATICFRVRETGEERWSLVKATPVLNQSGQVELAVNIFQDVTDLKRNEMNQRLLAESSKLMSASVDYATTLNRVAQIIVPKLADWCAIHVVDQDQSVQQLAVAHADEHKVALALELQEKYPPDPDAPSAVYKVIRSGEAEYLPSISEELLERSAQDEEHLEMMRQLSPKCALILPLIARDQVLGAITLVWAESGRRYSRSDMELAEEIARRAAIAIDNAHLYRQAKEINEELEARVIKRTSQLQRMINSLREEIAERKKAERALRVSEQMLQSLFDSAPDATILANRDGIIVRMNDQTERMFGYERDELMSKSVDLLLPSRVRSLHAKHRSDYIAEPRTRPMGANRDLYARRKDGSEFPVDIMLSPLETDQGTMIITAVRDISDSKKMRAELAESQRRFINSLEDERVKLAQDLHDGPIQDLYGVIFRLKSLTTDEGDKITIGEDDVDTTAEAVQHVIQVLRAVCGELQPPSLAPFGLEKAVREHATHFQEAHPEMDVHLKLTPDGQQLPESVRLVLFRVYQNAVSNVVRHAEARRLIINFDLDAEQAILEIADDGQGFELPSRWVEFARKGHLGLVGMVERVKAIGGNINIVASPGKGTSIRVAVPRE